MSEQAVSVTLRRTVEMGTICWCDGEPTCHGENDGLPDGLCHHCRLLGHHSLLEQINDQ